jgi:hypothetical protein
MLKSGTCIYRGSPLELSTTVVSTTKASTNCNPHHQVVSHPIAGRHLPSMEGPSYSPDLFNGKVYIVLACRQYARREAVPSYLGNMSYHLQLRESAYLGITGCPSLTKNFTLPFISLKPTLCIVLHFPYF